MIRNKTIKFNMDKAEDRALWEWLQTLPHGMFSEATKEHWKRMARGKICVEGTEEKK